ncbi:MAG: histidine--tRNA ligase [Candidatus Marinimicrobia bacterium]|nr:histidine--tRNA ligase [Candidatus Neomarinimicrobiota bacterium]|tara:strand:- start:22 stop:1278 length:1257 start_codon:yes stop_codon:yes gene_type:complete
MIRNIKGTKDLLPDDTVKWRFIESKIHKILNSYGYGEIRTPIFESTDLFIRGIGNETDIVSKEMYSWLDQGEKKLTLRPELTAPVVRSYIQHNLQSLGPIAKLYYFDSLFRRERPQAGRQRQFHQYGIEALGSEFPEQDAEVIEIAYNIYNQFNIKELSVRINTIGSSSIRENYIKILKKSLSKYKSYLSPISQKRLDNNALRIFDSKNEDDKKIVEDNAPFIFDHISDEDLNHFNQLKNILDKINIPYFHDKKLVRGLDYYTRTTFEITSKNLGAQDALCGGGRYDKLVKQLGGKNTPAVGFAAGVERLLMLINDDAFDQLDNIKIYISILGEQNIPDAMKIVSDLRKNTNLNINIESNRRSLKSQMREANRQKCSYVIIIGENELQSKIVLIKNMRNGEQEKIAIKDLNTYFDKNI